ncbi:MAG: ribosome biogenesis GTPase Der [Chromatiales bacterium]|jgi:GTP-binding protein
MIPVVALVGRPNVGKSTLFNQLTRSRDALVADMPGLTRDRLYGIARADGHELVVVDTGGLSGERDGIDVPMATQTLRAIDEASHVVFLVDGRAGLSAADEAIAEQLRARGKSVLLAVNKTDGVDPDQACAEFHSLGLGSPIPIAASHGRGIGGLLQAIVADLPQPQARASQDDEGIRIAFIGRPNVGKSTLVNRILGEERVVAFDQPGTTRDSIEIPFERDGRRYTLIDTAGVRRRARVREAVEKFSVVKALQAIESADVVIAVLDAREGIAEQDAHLLGFVLEAGRALVIAINKWDGLDADARQQVHRELDLKLGFLGFAERYFISALHGTAVGDLFPAIGRAYASACREVNTSELTRLLEQAVQAHQPPAVQGRRIKLRYAHQGGHRPPKIIIHGNQTQRLPRTYKRYLSNYFREALDLIGTPLRMEFKTGDNPYAGRRNTLTPRQQRKRERLKRFTKRKA